MNTKPIADHRTRCQYERIDEKKQHYCCDAPAVTIWLATEGVEVALCKACRNWIKTLESLDQEP